MTRVAEVHNGQEFLDTAACGGTIETLDCGKVIEEFMRGEMGIDAEILRQIAKNGSERIGRRENVQVIPVNGATGRARDGGQDAHEGGLAGAVGSQKPENTGPQFQIEIEEAPEIARIFFAERADGEFHGMCPLRMGEARTEAENE